jgi:hypothetical protein
MNKLRSFLPIALIIVAIFYSAATIFAFKQGGLQQVYMTVENEPSSLSFDTHIAINRVLYVLLCASLWISAALYRRRPRASGTLLIVALPLVYFDASGSFFDVLSSILHIANENPAFDRFYNDLHITKRLWQMSLLAVAVALVVALRSNTQQFAKDSDPCDGGGDVGGV